MDKQSYRTVIEAHAGEMEDEDFELIWRAVQKVINDRSTRNIPVPERFVIRAGIDLKKVLGVK